MNRITLLRTVAVLGASAVGLGAFGAHGLERLVEPEQIATFVTGVRYQFYHALALGFLLALGNGKHTGTVARLWLLGTLLFSGSLYLLSLRDVHGWPVSFLGPVTPVGGLLLIAGWVWLFVRAPRMLSLCFFLVAGCAAPGPAVYQPQRYAIDDALVSEDQTTTAGEIAATIAPYADQLADVMSRELAEVETTLTKGRPESTLGNWVADLMAAAATDLFPDRKVSFAVQNYGGLRVGEIKAGPLLVSEVYELMPFDNTLVLVELTGAEVARFAGHMIRSGGWPVSSGVRIGGSSDKPVLTIDGAPLEEAATYYLAVPDYVANGGSNSDMLVGKPQLNSGQLIRDLLIDYAARSSGPIRVFADGSRFTITE